MRDTDDVPDIAQAELEQLVRQDTRRIAEAEQAMIGKDSMQTHRPSVQEAFMAKITERGVPMDDLDLLSNENLS